MKTAHFPPLYLLVLICLSAAPVTQPAALAPDNLNYKAMLGDPPIEGSAEQKQEIDAMLDLQAHRSPEEIDRCKAEVTESVFVFGGDILGPGFNGADLPQTSLLLRDAGWIMGVAGGPAKANWNRKRPYVADDRIKPCIHLERSSSYPSGHAARGTVWAAVLAEIFPEHREALLARGKQFGTDRTLGGVHYPSDVIAGQKLGAEIAKRLLADPDFHGRLEKAKEECLADAKLRK